MKFQSLGRKNLDAENLDATNWGKLINFRDGNPVKEERRLEGHGFESLCWQSNFFSVYALKCACTITLLWNFYTMSELYNVSIVYRICVANVSGIQT